MPRAWITNGLIPDHPHLFFVLLPIIERAGVDSDLFPECAWRDPEVSATTTVEEANYP